MSQESLGGVKTAWELPEAGAGDAQADDGSLHRNATVGESMWPGRSLRDETEIEAWGAEMLREAGAEEAIRRVERWLERVTSDVDEAIQQMVARFAWPDSR